jgi:hypothetical protein
MTVSTGSQLKALFNANQAMGEKAVSSDAYFEIQGHEGIGLLIKQFPWPVLTSGGEIESSGPMGSVIWQQQQLKTAQQGQVGFVETQKGHIAEFLERIVAGGGYFEATVYEGTPDNFARKAPIHKCFLQLDNPDRDWENRAQLVLITGTLFFHYFGEK